jgi:hypothetical protein
MARIKDTALEEACFDWHAGDDRVIRTGQKGTQAGGRGCDQTHMRRTP